VTAIHRPVTCSTHCGYRAPATLMVEEGTFDGMEIFSCKVDFRRSEVFFKAMQLGCARNRNDPRLLGKQPGKHELSRCRPPLLRDLLSGSTNACFDLRFSGLKRGTVLLKSMPSTLVSSSILPVRKPSAFSPSCAGKTER
jgi:hypothetical protein